jgi:hypothetical protein
MLISYQNFFYRLGWSHAKVLMAMDILDEGTPSKVNKLMSEVAPQFRAMWHFSAGESLAKPSDRREVA